MSLKKNSVWKIVILAFIVFLFKIFLKLCFIISFHFKVVIWSCKMSQNRPFYMPPTTTPVSFSPWKFTSFNILRPTNFFHNIHGNQSGFFRKKNSVLSIPTRLCGHFCGSFHAPKNVKQKDTPKFCEKIFEYCFFQKLKSLTKRS